MKNNEVLVTKDLHSSLESELNSEIAKSLEIRDELVEKLDSNIETYVESKKSYKLAKKECKETIKKAKIQLKKKIALAKKEYGEAKDLAYVPLHEAELTFSSARFHKKKTSKKLAKIRAEISKLKSFKIILDKKYTSEKEEYIDINKWSKVYKKIDNN